MQARALRHIVIMLDIDDTIADHKASKDFFVYTGSRAAWYDNLKAFKAAALKLDIIVHYGIATSKEKYNNPYCESKGWRGDSLSAHLLGESHDEFIYDPKESLKELIEPDLVYFIGKEVNKILDQREECTKQIHKLYVELNKTPCDKNLLAEFMRWEQHMDDLTNQGHSAKAEFILKEVKAHLEKTYRVTIPAADIVIIDNIPNICEYSAKLGFNAICVTDDFVKAQTPVQINVINNIFQSILPGHFLEANTMVADDPIELALANMLTWRDTIKNLLKKPVSTLQKNSLFANDSKSPAAVSSSISMIASLR